MKPLIMLLSACFLIGCSDSNEKAETPKIPDALNSNSIKDLSRWESRNGDIFQNLYNEAVEENSQLQDIESQLDSLTNDEKEAKKASNTFITQNESYYRSAANYLAGISDSTLKQALKTDLKKSKESYLKIVNQHKNLIDRIESKKDSLENLHTKLKFKTTLAMLEKYQQNAIPKLKPLQQFINKQDTVISKIKEVIKK